MFHKVVLGGLVLAKVLSKGPYGHIKRSTTV